MASKARFFLATLVNGYKTYNVIYPAQKRTDLARILPTPDIRVVTIKYLGWAVVQVRPDEFDSFPEFSANVNGMFIIIRPNDIGYEYLQQQFSDKYMEVEDFINNPPY